MKAIATNIRLQFNEDRKAEIVTTLQTPQDIHELKEAVGKGKLLDIEIKPHRQRRSLNSNAYLWVLLEKMATVLKTSKDDLYLIMLDRYGVFTHVIVKPEAVERVKAEWRTVRELGKGKIGNMDGVQLQCYFGSSTYDTAEMARLIEGVMSEAKEIGIETLSPAEIALMNQNWGKE